jgi:hypothetical protein
MKKEQDWLILAFAIAAAILTVNIVILALYSKPASWPRLLRQHATYDLPRLMTIGPG